MQINKRIAAEFKESNGKIVLKKLKNNLKRWKKNKIINLFNFIENPRKLFSLGDLLF